MTSVKETFSEIVQEYRSRRPSLNQPSAPALHERDSQEQGIIIVGGSVLSFNAGWINAITFLEGGIGVSHVSGTLTLIGISITTAETKLFIKLFFCLLSFLVGSIMTGMIIPYSSFHLGRQYNRALLLESLFLLIGLIINTAAPKSIFFFFALSIACGIQNAITTKFSGNILRTTHHTGTVTDIGIFIGRAIMGHHQDTWKLYVLCPLPISYAFGAAIGTASYIKLNHISLIFNIIWILMLVAGYTAITFINFKKLREEEKRNNANTETDDGNKERGSLGDKNILLQNKQNDSSNATVKTTHVTDEEDVDIVDAMERSLEEEENRKSLGKKADR